MSRRPNLIPSVKLTTTLPLPIHSQLTAYLYSELENRVPLGAYQEFISTAVREFFDHKSLDLAPYISGATPGAFVVRGTPEAILALKYKLMESSQ